MELYEVTYQGPEISDPALFESLPEDLREMLSQVNGFIQFGGGFHLRGVCQEPEWHSLQEAWTGSLALSKLFPEVRESDIPFAQDALGDQYLLRDEQVIHLSAETGEVDELEVDFLTFLAAIQEDPMEALQLMPLEDFWEEGGELEPGQLLSAYPPFCTVEAESGVDYKPIPMRDRLVFRAHLAAQLKDVPDGAEIELVPEP
jgi:hypothetical protein